MGERDYSLKERLEKGSGNVPILATTFNRQEGPTKDLEMPVGVDNLEKQKLNTKLLFEKGKYENVGRLEERVLISEDGIKSLSLEKVKDGIQGNIESFKMALKVLEEKIQAKIKEVNNSSSIFKKNKEKELKELKEQKNRREKDISKFGEDLEILKSSNGFSELFKIINEAGLIDEYKNKTFSLYKLIDNLGKDLNNN